MKVYVLVDGDGIFKEDDELGHFFSSPAAAGQYIEDYNKDQTYKWSPTIEAVELDQPFVYGKRTWFVKLNNRGELTDVRHQLPASWHSMKATTACDDDGKQAFYAEDKTRQGAIDSATKLYEIWKSCIVTTMTVAQEQQHVDTKKFKELTGESYHGIVSSSKLI